MDPDKSGSIDFNEFNELFGPVLNKCLESKQRTKGLWKSLASKASA
jgi:hypothetical protein